MASRQLCTFYLDHHLYGISLDCLQEVTRHMSLTPVPASPPWIGGLLNLRGQIICAVDLRQRLALPKRDFQALPMNVVVMQDSELVSLLVDSVSDIIFVRDQDFSPIPPTLDPTMGAYIRGAYRQTDHLVVELDVGRLL